MNHSASENVAPGRELLVLSFTRTAVGDHLLLGGDNMDLALAYHVAQALANMALDMRDAVASWTRNVPRLDRRYGLDFVRGFVSVGRLGGMCLASS